MKEEILFLTHKKSREIEQAVRSIRDEMGDRSFTILSQSHIFDIDGTGLFRFDESIIQEVGFPAMSDSLVPGNVHFPIFAYINKINPDADYYWFIEYDVQFTGKWSILFDHFKDTDADLITSHIHHYHEEPDWYWWEISNPNTFIPKKDRIRSFNPIYRLSRKAITFLEQSFNAGWKGHNETTFPTLLYHHGFKLLDFNECFNDFQPHDKRFYISRSDRKGRLWTGTMRYRPAMRKHGLRKNKLYHPVKKENGLGFLRSNIGNFYRLVKLWLGRMNKKVKAKRS